MDSQRAGAIVSSPVMRKVTYKNLPVYMEKVNEKSGTCTIHYLNEPTKKENVPLSGLLEH